jgi:Leucine-rich repeat (LRR) protein
MQESYKDCIVETVLTIMDWLDQFVLYPDCELNEDESMIAPLLTEDNSTFESKEEIFDQPVITYNDEITEEDKEYDHREILNYGGLLHYDRNRSSINHNEIIRTTKKLWINDENIKEIPDYYINLVNVIELYANENKFSEVPEDIIHLKHLRHLCFYSNKIKRLPAEMFYLSQLRMLDLGSNYINEIPGEINMLTNLRRLHLNDNQIDELPEELFQLRKLRVLELQNNYLCDLSPSIILLECLEYLDISENEIDVLIPEVESHLEEIKKVIRNNIRRSTKPKTVNAKRIKLKSKTVVRKISEHKQTKTQNKTQRGKPYRSTPPSYPPPRPPGYTITPPQPSPSPSLSSNTSYNSDNYCGRYKSKLNEKEKAEFDNFCALFDEDFANSVSSSVSQVFSDNDSIEVSIVEDYDPCNANNTLDARKINLLDFSTDEGTDNDSGFDTDSEGYDEVDLNSSDEDLRSDYKNCLRQGLTKASLLAPVIVHENSDVSTNDAHKNFIDFNREKYKKSILTTVINFFDVFEEHYKQMNKTGNPEILCANRIVSENKIFSDIVKCRLVHVINKSSLLKLLEPNESASEPLSEKEVMILKLEPKNLFDYVISIIETLSTKNELYRSINAAMYRMFEWDIKVVSEIINKIFKFVDDYCAAELLANLNYVANYGR